MVNCSYCNLNSPPWSMWYISQESWPCHNTSAQLSGYGLSLLSVHLWTIILDIFVRICKLTHDPGSNERINAVMPMHWSSLNCVCYLLLKCILWHMPVSMCPMVDGVRILSENCHSRNVWGHRAIKFALTQEWHVWQKSLLCYMTKLNNRERQNTCNKTA